MSRWTPWIGLLLLAAAYGYLCRKAEGIDPGGWDGVLLQPERNDGHRVLSPDDEVVAVGPDGFTVENDGFRVRVITDTPVRAGDVVELSGTFRRDRAVVADRVVVLRHFRLKRAAMLVGSIAVLVAVAAGFIRARLPRFHEGLIEERPWSTPPRTS